MNLTYHYNVTKLALLTLDVPQRNADIVAYYSRLTDGKDEIYLQAKITIAGIGFLHRRISEQEEKAKINQLVRWDLAERMRVLDDILSACEVMKKQVLVNMNSLIRPFLLMKHYGINDEYDLLEFLLHEKNRCCVLITRLEELLSAYGNIPVHKAFGWLGHLSHFIIDSRTPVHDYKFMSELRAPDTYSESLQKNIISEFSAHEEYEDKAWNERHLSNKDKFKEDVIAVMVAFRRLLMLNNYLSGVLYDKSSPEKMPFIERYNTDVLRKRAVRSSLKTGMLLFSGIGSGLGMLYLQHWALKL